MHASGEYDVYTLIYRVRPLSRTVTNNTISGGNVALPAEYIELAAAKLRGELYKLANEDALATKWLESYNALLEDFVAYVAARAQACFGG